MGVECFKPYASEGKSIALKWHSATEDEIGLIVTLVNADGVLIKPLAMRGTYDEMTKNFMGEIKKSAQVQEEFASSMKELEAELEAAKKIKEQEVAKAKKPVSKETKERQTAPVDDDLIAKLTTIPASDLNFKGALEKASMLTLLSALTIVSQKSGSKSAFSKIAAELKKVTGNSADYYGYTYGDTVESEKEQQKGLFDLSPEGTSNNADYEGYTKEVDEEGEES